MHALSRSIRVLPILGISGFAALCASTGFVPEIDMIVTAEHIGPGAVNLTPAPGHPISCALFDAGFIEAGDPMVNDNPPAATDVRQALSSALASRGYLTAAPSAPSLILVYSWGVIAREHTRGIDALANPNRHARLSVVATSRQVAEIEGTVASSITPPQRNELTDLAGDRRYFVVVSAYDAASAGKREARLLWRAKMSTRSIGAWMPEAMTALISGGATYFGADIESPLKIRSSALPVVAPAAKPASAAPGGPWDDDFISALVRHEHLLFSGERSPDPLRKGKYAGVSPSGF